MRFGPDDDLWVVTDPTPETPRPGGEPVKIELIGPDGEVLFRADIGKGLKE